MRIQLLACFVASCLSVAFGELIRNGGFESSIGDTWECWHCTLQVSSTDHHSGRHSIRVTDRLKYFNGPAQYLDLTPGQYYHFTAWVKLLNDHDKQTIGIHLDIAYPDGKHEYPLIAHHDHATASDGWIHLVGGFTAPDRALQTSRLYFQSGPSEQVDFAVDDVSVVPETVGNVTKASLDQAIDKLRKSNINIQVHAASGINLADVKIHVLQTKKSFPFGTAVKASKYNSHAAGGRYEDFIHSHFNWAVPENALKWTQIEPHRGQKRYKPALDMIHRLKSHGLKVRGHNLVWSVPKFVQSWVKELSGSELRRVVQQHIEETMNVTRGLLEHWDVNNENLHGQWYQERLNDRDYNLELFRIAHHNDPSVKLFLNDYSVVSSGWSTNDYLIQAERFKAAGVGLYGVGVQCHFHTDNKPDPAAIKSRLDMVAEAGVPIWATELDVGSNDENKRADYYEAALTSLYAHPAVEGILFWGFWDQAHWRNGEAALVKGDNLELTAAGRRVLDLFENQWMTDETHALSASRDHISVRGFHGDYEARVIYKGRELSGLKKTFSLGKSDHSLSINVHT